MLDFETSSKSNFEISKSNSWKTTSFTKTTLLQREPFLTMFYYQPLPITRYQVSFYANSFHVNANAMQVLTSQIRNKHESQLKFKPCSYLLRMRMQYEFWRHKFTTNIIRSWTVLTHLLWNIRSKNQGCDVKIRIAFAFAGSIDVANIGQHPFRNTVYLYLYL